MMVAGSHHWFYSALHLARAIRWFAQGTLQNFITIYDIKTTICGRTITITTICGRMDDISTSTTLLSLIRAREICV